MDILIVETVWMGGARYGLLDKTLLTAFTILPTLQARQLAAMTPSEHRVTVVNERYEPIRYEHRYDVVCINFTTSTAPHAYDIADAFRRKGAPVVLSGLHASAVPEEARQHADAVLCGRGELSWLKVLQDLQKGELQPFYEPKPYSEQIPLPPTQVSLPGFVLTGAVEATRGCPYQCPFCPETHLSDRQPFFKRPVEDVVAEVRSLPHRLFMFYDATLTVDVHYTTDLFRRLKGEGKRFFVNGNVDVLARNPDLVKLSREAGCIAWFIGFESAAQATLKALAKITNEVGDYRRAVENIHRHGMAVVGSFMLGADTDTVETFAQTSRLIDELGIDVVDFCILTPLPGTPLFKELDAQGRILTKDWSRYTLNQVVFQPKHMSVEQLQKGVLAMHVSFYSPANTVRRLLRGLRLGPLPFLVIAGRNVVATMVGRRLQKGTNADRR